jgi:predicted metalloendopeptidase
MTRSPLLLFASALALTAGAVACKQADKPQIEAKAGTKLGINPAAMDTSVKPGDDFFRYANGGWLDKTEIPGDRSSIGAFYIADQVREKNTRELFDNILKSNADANSDEGRIANYYKAYLDTAAIDRAGLNPAKADLQAIAGIADKRALAAAIGKTLRADVDPLNATNFQTDNLFGVFVTQGLNTPGEQLPYLMQGGIGMPEREYYLSSDAKMAGLRDKYRTYVETVMKAAGSPDPKAAADRIIALETRIA